MNTSNKNLRWKLLHLNKSGWGGKGGLHDECLPKGGESGEF